MDYYTVITGQGMDLLSISSFTEFNYIQNSNFNHFRFSLKVPFISEKRRNNIKALHLF